MGAINLLINGRLVPGDMDMPILNPATEEVLSSCPRASKGQLDEAVAGCQSGVSGLGGDSDRTSACGRRENGRYHRPTSANSRVS